MAILQDLKETILLIRHFRTGEVVNSKLNVFRYLVILAPAFEYSLQPGAFSYLLAQDSQNYGTHLKSTTCDKYSPSTVDTASK